MKKLCLGNEARPRGPGHPLRPRRRGRRPQAGCAGDGGARAEVRKVTPSLAFPLRALRTGAEIRRDLAAVLLWPPEQAAGGQLLRARTRARCLRARVTSRRRPCPPGRHSLPRGRTEHRKQHPSARVTAVRRARAAKVFAASTGRNAARHRLGHKALLSKSPP